MFLIRQKPTLRAGLITVRLSPVYNPRKCDYYSTRSLSGVFPVAPVIVLDVQVPQAPLPGSESEMQGQSEM